MLDLILAIVWIAFAASLAIMLVRGIVRCFVDLKREHDIKSFAFNFLLKGLLMVGWYYLFVSRGRLADDWATIVAGFQP